MSKPMNPSSTAAAEAPFSLRAILPSLLAIIVGMIMVILDSTAVNVAVRIWCNISIRI